MNELAMYNSIQTAGEQLEQHIPLVKRIAFHLMTKLHDTVQVDDLIQAGMLGLLEAMKNYDSSRGASFETYAGIRIRGFMLDEVRRSDWAPRSVHKKARMIAEAIQKIENKTGKSAKDKEVAEYLNIGLDEYNRILQDAVSSRIFSIEELSQTGDAVLGKNLEAGDEPIEKLSQDGFRNALETAISSLPEREGWVVSLYYDDELNLKEIGEVLGVSESRVCQICTQATLRLRARLSEWLEGGKNEYTR